MSEYIVAICSSPRQGSNSAILAETILRGAAALGARVEKVMLQQLAIGPCRGCNFCHDKKHGECINRDDMIPLLGKLREASGIVFAAPIYFAAVNGIMKNCIDRMYALFGGSPGWNAMKGKRCALAFSYFNRDPLQSGPVNALRMFQDMASELRIDLVGWVHASCRVPKEVLLHGEVIEAAEKLGRELAGCNGATFGGLRQPWGHAPKTFRTGGTSGRLEKKHGQERYAL